MTFSSTLDRNLAISFPYCLLSPFLLPVMCVCSWSSGFSQSILYGTFLYRMLLPSPEPIEILETITFKSLCSTCPHILWDLVFRFAPKCRIFRFASRILGKLQLKESFSQVTQCPCLCRFRKKLKGFKDYFLKFPYRFSNWNFVFLIFIKRIKLVFCFFIV